MEVSLFGAKRTFTSAKIAVQFALYDNPLGICIFAKKACCWKFRVFGICSFKRHKAHPLHTFMNLAQYFGVKDEWKTSGGVKGKKCTRAGIH